MKKIYATFHSEKTSRLLSAALTFLMACVLAAFTILGRCLAKTQSLDFFLLHPQNMKLSILEFAVYLLFYFCFIYFIFYLWDNSALLEKFSSHRTIARFVDTHSFLAPWAIIFIAWLPYLIVYYPGIFMGDTAAQIKQFYQLPNAVSNGVNLLSASQLITNHHPVIHTLMLGGALKFGQTFLHSENAGIFLYTLLQYTCCSAVLAYSISYMKKLRSPRLMRIIALLFIAFFPVFPRYAVLLSKDSYFAGFLLLFEILLLDLVRNPEALIKKRGKLIALFLAALGTMLFRQNGILAVFFSFPVLFLQRRNRKLLGRATLVFVLCIGVYFAYMQILLPAFSITPGSRRETLSIPFQQTASYVNKHEDEVTEEEYQAISAVLDYNKILKKYNPNLSDPVKNTFNEDATSQDLKNYFKVWFAMFLKHPGSYIEATLNNYYGYLYIGRTSDKHYVSYYMDQSTGFMDRRLNKKGFGVHHIAALRPLALKLEGVSDWIYDSWLYIFESSGFYSWLIMLSIVFMLRKRNFKYLCVLLPALSIFLVCLISPANGIYYFRYSFPLAYLAPLILSMCTEEPKEEFIKNPKLFLNYPLTS